MKGGRGGGALSAPPILPTTRRLSPIPPRYCGATSEGLPKTACEIATRVRILPDLHGHFQHCRSAPKHDPLQVSKDISRCCRLLPYPTYRKVLVLFPSRCHREKVIVKAAAAFFFSATVTIRPADSLVNRVFPIRTGDKTKMGAVFSSFGSTLLIAGLLIAAYAGYRAALPKQLPGIPYNRDAAGKLFGDIPEMMGYVIRTKRIFVSRRVAYAGCSSSLG